MRRFDDPEMICENEMQEVIDNPGIVGYTKRVLDSGRKEAKGMRRRNGMIVIALERVFGCDTYALPLCANSLSQ